MTTDGYATDFDRIDPPTVKCPHCGGAGERGCSGGYLERCGTCEGTGKVEPCCICGAGSVTLYDDRDGCPSCGRAACELRMQAGLDYHEEAGDR